MQDNTVLQRFKKFKEMMVSSNIPAEMFLDMVENYLTLDDDDTEVESIPVFDGQLSLLDTPNFAKEMMSA